MWKYLLFIPMLAFMVACDDEDDNMTPEPVAPTLSAALDATADLSTLETVIGSINGLVADLEGRDAITVFAPNNAAFNSLLNGRTLDELVADIGGTANLEKVLQYHVVAGTAFAADLSNGQKLTTLEGSQLTVNIAGSVVTVSDVSENTWTVQTADVAIANGVVHIINGVLLPELPMPEAPTLSTALDATASLSLLDAAIAAVDGLETDLEGLSNITVFAPNNDAFNAALNAYGVDNLNDLVTELGGVAKLDSVLGFHVVPATAFSTDLSDGDKFTTAIGQELTITINNDGVFVNGAKVSTPDVAIANGVVHIIDAVLLPELDYPNIVEAGTAAGLTTLLEAVTAVELGATLTGAEAITVFAPKNGAFIGLLDRYDASGLPNLIEILGAETVANVLKFHVIPSTIFSHDVAEGDQTIQTLEGQELTVNKASDGTISITDYLNFTYTVEMADVVIDNGVVHIIDGVLLPDVSDESNIVEAATTAGLTTLIDAIVKAELTNTLLQATEITVFAPDNDAFADLLQAQEVADLDALITKLGAPAVVEVLQFHVVPAVAFADDLAADQMFTTLSGENIRVQKSGATVTVTDAAGETYTVTTPDVAIENGVVHVINGVLLPTLDD